MKDTSVKVSALQDLSPGRAQKSQTTETGQGPGAVVDRRQGAGGVDRQPQGRHCPCGRALSMLCVILPLGTHAVTHLSHPPEWIPPRGAPTSPAGCREDVSLRVHRW